jgi:hypothetical protein
MPEFVGLKNSNFDPQKFSKHFEENCGVELNTESILSGIKRVAPLFTGELVAMIKESGMYVSDATAEK